MVLTQTFGILKSNPLTGELALPLPWAAWESWPCWYRHGRAGRWINATITQTQIQGLGLFHPNIQPVCDLLECMKGLILQKHGLRISTTPDNSKVYEREDLAEARGLEADQMTHYSEPLQGKLFGGKGTAWHTAAPRATQLVNMWGMTDERNGTRIVELEEQVMPRGVGKMALLL